VKGLLSLYKNLAAVALPALVGFHFYTSAPSDNVVPHPSPQPASSVVAAGHSYAVRGLCGTYADALDQAGKDVAAGKPMAAAIAGLQSSWQIARQDAGEAALNPILSAIIPAGSEGDPASRARWAAAAHDLATGMRGVK
jgi:hypothetical protein